MGAVGQGFMENGFGVATVAEFGKRRNPQYATCFDACGAVCLVLSLFPLSFSILSFSISGRIGW